MFLVMILFDFMIMEIYSILFYVGMFTLFTAALEEYTELNIPVTPWQGISWLWAQWTQQLRYGTLILYVVCGLVLSSPIFVARKCWYFDQMPVLLLCSDGWSSTISCLRWHWWQEEEEEEERKEGSCYNVSNIMSYNEFLSTIFFSTNEKDPKQLYDFVLV